MSDAKTARIEVPEGPDLGLAWHYGDPLGEQRAMLDGRGVVDLGNRELVRLSGDERLSWLDNVTSGVFTGKASGEPLEGLILDAQGHIQHGFHGVDDGESLLVWTEPGTRAALLEWFTKMRFWAKVDFEPVDDLRLVWVGAHVAAEATDGVVLGTDRAGGALIAAADPAAFMGRSQPCGVWAYEALRIDAGVPRLGIDTDEKAIPNEIGLYATVLGKGCYPGQETVARVHTLGRPPRRLTKLYFDGVLPETGSAILAGEKHVGQVTSVAQHCEWGPIGLALVKRSVPADETLVVGDAGIAASQETIVDPEVGEHFRPKL